MTHLGLLSLSFVYWFWNFDLSKILAACMRLQLHIMGIHYKVKGKLMPKDVCPIGVSGGHSSFLDSWICFAFLCSQDQIGTIMEDWNASKVLKRRKQIFLDIKLWSSMEVLVTWPKASLGLKKVSTKRITWPNALWSDNCCFINWFVITLKRIKTFVFLSTQKLSMECFDPRFSGDGGAKSTCDANRIKFSSKSFREIKGACWNWGM